jgi:hypothetical protein
MPPGVLLDKVSWGVTGTLQDGRTTSLVSQYTQRFPGYPPLGLPPQELALAGSHIVNDGYAWLGCYNTEICPATEWVEGPPFRAWCSITTTDGGAYSTTVELPPA